jgi:DNA mismatch endonuclease (patch repair protein)
VDPARSAQMARIKGKDTQPEMRVRRALHKAGLRYRLHDKRLPGRPDIVFPSRKVVVLVQGCFWHRHPDPSCPLTRTPKSRLEFWRGKFAENQARDARNRVALEAAGWRVLEIWECQTGDKTQLEAVVGTIKETHPVKPIRP